MNESPEAAQARIQQIRGEFDRFLAWLKLCEKDWETFHLPARQAAYESLAGSPKTNNREVPATWLAVHFPDDALPKLSEFIRQASTDPSPWAHWGKVAYDILAALGPKADLVLQACASTTLVDTVRGGVNGAIKGGYTPPNPTISRMLRRLLDVDDVRTRLQAIEIIGSWDSDEFIPDLKALDLPDEDPEVRTAARWLLARIEAAKLELSPIEQDRIMCEKLIADTPLAAVRDALLQGMKPCLHLRTTVCRQQVTTNTSKIGGVPSLPVGVDWPTSQYGRPLPFVALLASSDIRRIEPSWSHSLLFFAHWETMEARVIPMEDGLAVQETNPPVDLDPDFMPKECYLSAEEGLCLPQKSDDDALEAIGVADLSPGSWELLSEILINLTGRKPNETGSVHRFLGYPHFIQASPIPQNNDSCEWISLLSLESDNEAALYFGDDGTMTFTIPQEDWNRRCFDNVQLWVDSY